MTKPLFKVIFEDIISLHGKYRVGRIVRIAEKANSKKVTAHLTEGFSLATTETLLAYKSTWGNSKGFDTVIALGSIGPAPYAGNPGLAPDGNIVSLGLPEESLEWSEGSLFLLLKDEVVIDVKEKMIATLKNLHERTSKDPDIEAIITESGTTLGDRSIRIAHGAKYMNNCVKCTYSYTDGKSARGPWEGMISIDTFKQITV